MNILKAFCLAFSTYSRIPMIRVYPNKENLRYLLCYFPLVGAAIGGLLMLWYTICLKLGINNACFAAVATVLPILVTGGIHADGYIDTNDAFSSYGSKQKKMEILSDPHVGAFGIITAIVYYLLYFGMMNEVTIYGEVGMIGLGFIMSRSLCAIEIALMRTAKNSGMLYELSQATNRTVTIIVMIIMLAACALTMIFLSAYVGGMALGLLILLLIYYKFFIAKKLTGITGDTCGWFIMMSELLVLIAIVIGGKVATYLPPIPPLTLIFF